eukprot:m.116315 g.116315  ORF g.116315 m.116315 type:complete len:59 (+) comp51938_c0_seq4:785-961(+)
MHLCWIWVPRVRAARLSTASLCSDPSWHFWLRVDSFHAEFDRCQSALRFEVHFSTALR